MYREPTWNIYIYIYLLCNIAKINHCFMLHSFIVISFGLLRFVVLYLFTGMVMTTTVVVILVTDMFLQRSSVIPFADLKFSGKHK